MKVVANVRAKLKVLVVDDEPLVADSMAQVLNLFRYEATSLYNSSQAMERVGTHPCDLLVSDVIMDGHMSGIDSPSD